MLDHVSLGASDLERSRRFYDAVLQPLGLVRTVNFEGRGSDYGNAPGQPGVEVCKRNIRAILQAMPNPVG